MSSPPAWGCLRPPGTTGTPYRVLPTRVGVPPSAGSGASGRRRPPHPRGGASTPSAPGGRGSRSSPPAWGCLRRASLRGLQPCVLPTRVGVPPRRDVPRQPRPRPPHPRGGASVPGRRAATRRESSPPAWGCLHRVSLACHHDRVLPTRVGVPRAHRGAAWRRTQSSPPAWGCLRLRQLLQQRRERPPHPRGGASDRHGRWGRVPASSPPAWGCLRGGPGRSGPVPVLPTRVGVPPSHNSCSPCTARPPHPRGGASRMPPARRTQ